MVALCMSSTNKLGVHHESKLSVNLIDSIHKKDIDVIKAMKWNCETTKENCNQFAMQVTYFK